MRRIGLMLLTAALSGCVAVWGSGYHVESEDANGGAIRFDHVVISARAVAVHANELCSKYQRVAVVQQERHSVVLPGGSIGEISYNCQPLPPVIEASVATTMSHPPEPTGKSGSGYVIDASGSIVTNFHVVNGCVKISARHSDNSAVVTVAASDQTNDLALLKGTLQGTTPPRFRSGSGIRPADSVIAIGYPYAGLLSSTPQTSVGTVTALAGIADDTRMLQISAPVQPGNSGGPLLDSSGNVVGMVVATLDPLIVAKATGSIPQNINFAIKASVVREFLDTNGIKYASVPSGVAMAPADVSEIGTRAVVLVECTM